MMQAPTSGADGGDGGGAGGGGGAAAVVAAPKPAKNRSAGPGTSTMNSYKRTRAMLQRLEAEALARSLELTRLQEENGRLMAEHALLATTADSLDAVRSQLAAASSGGHPPCSTPLFPALASEAERALLRQLCGLPYGANGLSADDINDAWSAAVGAQPMLTPLPAAPGGSRGGGGGGSGGGDTAAASAAAAGAAAGAGPQPSPDAAGESEEEELLTSAPASAPLMLMARGLLKPMHPNASALTQADLVEFHAATVRELALQVVLHDASSTAAVPGGGGGISSGGGGDGGGGGGAGGLPPAVAAMRELLEKYLWVLSSVARQGGPGIVVGLTCTRLDTGEACEPSPERHAWLVRQLGLSDAQLGRVVRGRELFERLLAPVMQERSALQQAAGVATTAQGQGQAAASSPASLAAAAAAVEAAATPDSGDSCASKSNSAGSTGTSSNGTSSNGLGSGGDDANTAATEVAAARLRLLLDKEFMLRTAYSAHTLGALTWPQLARAWVIMWPFCLHNQTLAYACVELLAERRRQQQQQQQPRRQQQEETAADGNEDKEDEEEEEGGGGGGGPPPARS